MEIKFTDSFFKSVKKLNRDHMWYMRLLDLFRYDIPHYLRNLKRFNKILWNYRGWNGDGSLLFMEESLKYTCYIIENYGHEVDESRLKKVAKMKRACEILNNINNDRYVELVEEELGRKLDTSFSLGEPDENGNVKLKLYKNEEEKEFSSRLFELSRSKEIAEWKELWQLLEGQDLTHLIGTDEDYEKHFDGSGLNGWWD